jgi:hypothetical protein
MALDEEFGRLVTMLGCFRPLHLELKLADLWLSPEQSETCLAQFEREPGRDGCDGLARAFDEAHAIARLASSLRSGESGHGAARAVRRLRVLVGTGVAGRLSALRDGCPDTPAGPTRGACVLAAQSALETLLEQARRLDQTYALTMTLRNLGLAYQVSTSVDGHVARALSAIKAGADLVQDEVDAWVRHLLAGSETHPARRFAITLSQQLGQLSRECQDPFVVITLSPDPGRDRPETPVGAVKSATGELALAAATFVQAARSSARGVIRQLNAHAVNLEWLAGEKLVESVRGRVQGMLREGLRPACVAVSQAEIEDLASDCTGRAINRALSVADQRCGAGVPFDGLKMIGLFHVVLFGRPARKGRPKIPGLIAKAIAGRLALRPTGVRPDDQTDGRRDRKELLLRSIESWAKEAASIRHRGRKEATHDMLRFVRQKLKRFRPEDGEDFRLVLGRRRLSWCIVPEARSVLSPAPKPGTEVPRRVMRQLVVLFPLSGDPILTPYGSPRELARQLAAIRATSRKFPPPWSDWTGQLCDWLEVDLRTREDATGAEGKVALRPLLELHYASRRLEKEFRMSLFRIELHRRPQLKARLKSLSGVALTNELNKIKNTIYRRYERAYCYWCQRGGLNERFPLIRLDLGSGTRHLQEVVR